MVFSVLSNVERRAERDEEDTPVEQAHLLVDLPESALAFTLETS